VPLDEIVVVDDSPDGSLGPVPAATVVRSHGGGPYRARNVGWRSATADVVVFLDMRSRPRPTWAQQIAGPFEDDGVAVVGSEVRVLPGTSLGARAANRQQFFQLRNYLANPFFRPYLPTCNLAVRRADLRAVGGFSEIRSGGDADLCWRILSRPGRRLHAVREVLMDWVPRERSRDYVEQNYRYGRSNHHLRLLWQSKGAAVVPAKSHLGLTRHAASLSLRFAVARARGDDERSADLLLHAAGLCFDVGYRIAVDRHAVTPRARSLSPSTS
jgi:cellulose synthase/poly-beta-1,6-N-acetylglucosamine synthase-like glycosyltransferase